MKQTRSIKATAVIAFAVTALAIGVLPSFAAPASQHYQVATDKNIVQMGASLRVIATVKQATPNCAYSVLLTVTGPGGVSATDTVTVDTQAGGNGHTAASFPSDFTGTANTDTVGTYSVSATFTCGYTTYAAGSASSTFTVK